MRVLAVDRLTDDSVAVTLDADWAFASGQHVVVVKDGERRTYSVCSPEGGPLRIGVKELPGGAVSPWLCGIVPGEELEVLPPTGAFGPRVPLRRVGLVGAGSGVTPLVSIAATQLAYGASVSLVLGNRTARDVMLLDDLNDLKDRYGPRFQLVHVLSREEGSSELVSGRLDEARLERLLGPVVPVEADGWWLCGPLGVVDAARAVLAARGVTQVHAELFFAEAAPPREHVEVPGAQAVVTLNGRTSTVPLGADSVLDAVLRARADAPYACKGGVCGTCRAKVTAGEVEMDVNYALEPAEVAAGVVLTCQAHPLTDVVELTYL